MGKIYGGHLVSKFLKEIERISTVFGLCGGHIDSILDGLFEHKIRAIDVRHEQAAVMMAHAWSIYGNHVGISLVTAGPGFTNALTGLVNAFLDNVPLVLISGTAPIKDVDKGALQDMDQLDMIRSYVKWGARCMETARIPEYLSKAINIAKSGRPGPVFLEFPPDVLNKKIEESEIIYPNPSSKYNYMGPMKDIKKAAELINNAKRPLLIAGSGIAYSNCQDELIEFIEKTNIPFALMNAGRGTIPDEHPLSLWDGGQTAILTAASQADLVISLGIRYNWLLLFGQIFPQAKHIRVDIEPSEINMNRVSDVGIAGDIGLVLRQLVKEVKKVDRKEYVRELKDSYSSLISGELEQRQKTSTPIHPARLVEVVKNIAPRDSIFIADGGDISYFALMGLKANTRGGVLGSASGQFGCLGTGIPFGIAAKLAQPEQEVFVINGDGSFGFNAMEFDTAIRHGVKITCVISNDRAWGMIKHGQELNYGSDRVYCSELRSAHYEGIVKALGGHGEFVEKHEELEPALKRAIASDKPSCVNVLTDPAVTSPVTLLFSDSLKVE